MVNLWASSLYGWKSKSGRVDLYQTEEDIEKPVWHMQVSVEEARHFAMSILEAAEAAETDEVVMTWLRDEVKMPGEENLAKTLMAFRKIRDARRQ